MKLSGLVVVSALALANSAQAAEPAADREGLYLGVKGIYSQLRPDGMDNSGGFGVLIADHYQNGLGVELEVTRSQADIHLLDLVDDYTLDTAAAYGVYRSAGNWYYKLRGGVIWKQLQVTGGESDKTAFAGGLGGGYDFGRLLLELEYTYVDQDVDQLSLSLIGRF